MERGFQSQIGSWRSWRIVSLILEFHITIFALFRNFSRYINYNLRHVDIYRTLVWLSYISRLGFLCFLLAVNLS